MKRALLLCGAALTLTSSLALAAPESLLPPIFDNPPAAPAPTPAPRPAPAQGPAPSAAPAPSTNAPVVQPVPGLDSGVAIEVPNVSLPSGFPSLAQLEAMDEDEFNELFGLQPKFDIPPGARRSLREVGVIDVAEGGFAPGSLDNQPAALVRAALAANRGPLVSRWGHILLRRALVSRLNAPEGMEPVTFAALRGDVLNRMGEAPAARALVQDVDSANYDAALAGVAFNAYLATGDVLGICPVAQLKSTLRDDPEWQMGRAICDAYSGNARQAERELQRMLYYGVAPRVDALLAQRFAGAAGESRREVNVEWNGVEELTPWRFALARSLGIELPENLRQSGGYRYDIGDALIPAVPLVDRAAGASTAAARGILSADAAVDLYAQLWDEGPTQGEWRDRASALRNAYAAREIGDRFRAIESLWGDGGDYGNLVLTAYAAARLPVAESLIDDAPRIIASMLAAGLDRNAMRWGAAVPEGGQAWALLALAQPERGAQVGQGAVETYISDNDANGGRKARFLVAGLAGLGRLDMASANSFAGDLGMNLRRESAWSRKIDMAAELDNPALVVLLAGLGMQGDSWEKMTARHLFHIVRALDRVGLNAEARMIAAEAVARG